MAVPDPMSVSVQTLPNGLQLWVSPNHEQPRVRCRVVVRAGAAMDPRDQTGVAHQLEHILANKGGAKLQRGELKELFGLLGGRSLNAYTGHDRTSYVVDVPSVRLAAWAEVERDRLGGPVLNDGFDSEMEVIRQEKRRALDEPARALSEALSRALWGEHPYAAPILGEVEHISAPSAQSLAEFHARWYTPANLAVVLAGDVEPEQARALVEQAFGDLPQPDGQPEPPALGVASEPTRAEVQHRGSEALRMGWRLPPTGHADHDALRLVSAALSNGSTGLIDRHLVQPQVVRAASASAMFARFGGQLVVTVVPRADGSLEQGERLGLEQVRRLLDGELQADELASIVRNLRVGLLRSFEDDDSRARRMEAAFFLGRSWDDVRLAVERMSELTVDDVLAAAGRWLAGTPTVAWRRAGEPDMPPMQAAEVARQPLPEVRSGFFAKTLARPAEATTPQVLVAGQDFERRTGRSGPVVTVTNPFSDLAAVGLRWYGGSEADRGIGSVLALWGKAGAGALTRTDLERAVHDRACSLRVSSGRFNVDLAVRGPAEQVPFVLDLARRRMSEPTLSAPERLAWVEDRLARRVADRTKLDLSVSALRSYARRGERSGLLELRLSEGELRDLAASADVGARIAPLLARQRSAVCVGPVEPDAVDEALGAGAAAVVQMPEPIRYVSRSRPTVLLLHHASSQATVSFDLPAEPWRREGLAVRRLWAEYVGGKASMVFHEIRELRGLAYSAQAGLNSGWRAGDEDLVWASVGCDPGRVAEVAGLLSSILPEPVLDEARWERARATSMAAMQEARVRFRKVGWTVERWRLRGLEPDPRAELAAELPGVTWSDVQAYGRSLGARCPTISVIGDLDKVDVAALASLGEVRRMALDELVVD